MRAPQRRLHGQTAPRRAPAAVAAHGTPAAPVLSRPTNSEHEKSANCLRSPKYCKLGPTHNAVDANHAAVIQACQQGGRRDPRHVEQLAIPGSPPSRVQLAARMRASTSSQRSRRSSSSRSPRAPRHDCADQSADRAVPTALAAPTERATARRFRSAPYALIPPRCCQPLLSVDKPRSSRRGSARCRPPLQRDTLRRGEIKTSKRGAGLLGVAGSAPRDRT
jgi:hypothetical protein